MGVFEPDDFKSIYDRYAKPLYGYIYRFTGDASAAEEILHDVFVQLLSGQFNGPSNGSDDGSLKAWLYTVAKNRGLNYAKYSSKRQKVPVDENRSNAEAATPEDQLISRDLTLRLAKSEAALSTDLRETWDLRKEGLDYKEIAARLSIPVGTVKSRFNRLVDILRTEFNP